MTRLANRDVQRIGRSDKYKYLNKILVKGKIIKWSAYVLNKSKTFFDEREGAIWVDTILILAGKQPVNILKPKI